MAEALTNQALNICNRKIISCRISARTGIKRKAASRGDFLWKDPAARSAADAAKRKPYRYLPTQRNALSVHLQKKSQCLYQTRKLIEPTVCRKYISFYSKSRLLSFYGAV